MLIVSRHTICVGTCLDVVTWEAHPCAHSSLGQVLELSANNVSTTCDELSKQNLLKTMLLLYGTLCCQESSDVERSNILLLCKLLEKGQVARVVNISEFRGKSALHPRRHCVVIAMLFLEIGTTLAA